MTRLAIMQAKFLTRFALLIAVGLQVACAIPTGFSKVPILNESATASQDFLPISDISTFLARFGVDDSAASLDELAENITRSRNITISNSGKNQSSILPSLARNKSLPLTSSSMNSSTGSTTLFQDPYDGFIASWKQWTQKFYHYTALHAPASDVRYFADYMLVSAHLRQEEAHARESDELPSNHAIYLGGPPRMAFSMSFYIHRNGINWTWGDHFAAIGLFRQWSREWDVGRVPSCFVELYDWGRFGVTIAIASFAVTGISEHMPTTVS